MLGRRRFCVRSCWLYSTLCFAGGACVSQVPYGMYMRSSGTLWDVYALLWYPMGCICVLLVPYVMCACSPGADRLHVGEVVQTIPSMSCAYL